MKVKKFKQPFHFLLHARTQQSNLAVFFKDNFFSNGNYKTKKHIFIQFGKGKEKKKNRKEKPQLSTLLVSLLVKRFIGSTSSVSNSEVCNSDGLHLVLTVFFVVVYMAMSFVCKIVWIPNNPLLTQTWGRVCDLNEIGQRHWD